ncbi:mRNA-decapping enzyme subunit 2 isoform X1 [Selaginella moellendorffii]|uniref:mRNA-decapping enzyme subunit 2 isoform X1 n=1 Tax=Selaginella moellendorffii TaxID=88036 RepID=UPI000D1C70EE|nr:mRNA-decapping enzyme subunit 2 isoform X1 [Selaginella moellendorffii]|eukprot:XP_024518432.1 mRNA-decapping enzyme subunit 2 isoform X1 [Selaginella moellendorffii]
MAAGGGNGKAQGGHSSRLPSQEMLDDLCSRFVLNAPEEELESFERILFLLEQAHWFYEDNTMEQNASLKSLTLREFTALMFQKCVALRPYIAHFDDIYKNFTSYKTSVPVTGAIILDESYERCLMVKGWKPGASWTFPRGKKNKDEEDHNCAIREVCELLDVCSLTCSFIKVWEETGFDVSELIRTDDHLEVVIGQQRMRLFIVGGVPEETLFIPQTKKEISEIAWHRIEDLPKHSNESSHNRGPTGLKYYMVWPFLRPLQAWIVKNRPLITLKSDNGSKGVTVWKANTSGHTTFSTPIMVSHSVTVVAVKETTSTSFVDLPGKSFRNFRFDVPQIVSHIV